MAKRTPVTSTGRALIADLRDHFDDDQHLTPEQMAEYRHRLQAYARSGEAQPELTLEPTLNA